MPTTTRINANTFKVYYGTDATRATTTAGAAGERLPFANSTTATLSITTDMIDVTNKETDRWKEIIPGLRSWSVSSEAQLDNLATTSTTSRTAITTGELATEGMRVYLEIGVGDARWVGSGYITSFDTSGGTNEVGSVSIAIDGDGPLTFDGDVAA